MTRNMPPGRCSLCYIASLYSLLHTVNCVRAMISVLAEKPQIQHHFRKSCVAVANEPRAYREVMAETLRDMRPDIDFVILEPEELKELVQTLKPDLAICDEATIEVRANAAFWLELYPDQNYYSIFGSSREHSRIENIQLSDIVSIVDQAVSREVR